MPMAVAGVLGDISTAGRYSQWTLGYFSTIGSDKLLGGGNGYSREIESIGISILNGGEKTR